MFFPLFNLLPLKNLSLSTVVLEAREGVAAFVATFFRAAPKNIILFKICPGEFPFQDIGSQCATVYAAYRPKKIVTAWTITTAK